MLHISPQDRVFVLTGAGISAESGLPTFRGEGGLWRNYRVEEIASPFAWRRDPGLVWEFYSMRRRAALAVRPNPGHAALAEFQRGLGDRLFLCTQNVDDLHEQAGSERIVHMHGELLKSRCDRCSRPPFEDRNIYDSAAGLPRCACGGPIRPHICWFDEVPFHLDKIQTALEDCTVFIAIGTSGTVQPAASFAALAGRHARTIYVGPDAPANNASFREVVRGMAAETLPAMLLGAGASPQ